MRCCRIIASLLVLGLVLVSCRSSRSTLAVQPITRMPQGTDGYPWWNDTVFYEIFVRSYYDSNGDGIGDLSGLIEKLDYLNDGDQETSTDLGVTGIWLMPVHPASSYHGYDLLDYYAINPEYGSIEEFKRLLDEAHQRGMRVIIDLVLNHTSSDHAWFVASRDPTSEYRDWYVWSEAEPSGSGWHATDTGYYLGIFWEGMPDLNYTNPAVTMQMQDIVRYWLQDIGVDGFRLDAAKHLIEEGTLQSHSKATHDWYKDFRQFYKSLNPQAITVGEVWDSSVAASKYITGDEFDLAFDFDLAESLVTSARLGRAEQVSRIMSRDWGLFPPGQFATFLTNHDQDRSILLFGEEVGKAKSAASALLTLPGAPFIYYGEEIGMFGKKPDEMIRTPMQWTADENAGFTDGVPWISVYPDFAAGKNVADESADPDSLLSHYRKLIHLRNQHVALRVGDYFPVEVDNEAIFTYLRASKEEVVLVILNLGKDPINEFYLTLGQGPLKEAYEAVVIFGEDRMAEDEVLTSPVINAKGGFDTYKPLVANQTLPANGSLIVQLRPIK